MDGLWEIIKDYEKNQWHHSDELYKIQRDKLKRLLSHCQQNVPYYRELFRYVGFDASKPFKENGFTKIPQLTKKIINENRDFLKANTSKMRDLVKNSTSGSTGENLYFYQDKNAMMNRQAVVWRNFAWVDCLYADRQAYLWGAPLDVNKSRSFFGKLHAFFNRSITLSSYDLSEESMWKYFRQLNKHKPKLFVSYPSPLATFAKFLLENDIKIPSIKSIITSAETLYLWQRSIIEKAFECSIYDRYGTREFGNIAHECDKHEGYHINLERFYIEILNEKGCPAAPKEIGEIIITDLDNYGFPFIRYRIEDLAIPSNKQCSCGRGLPLIEKIEGRSFDIVTAPNGNKIAGTFWTLTLRAIPGIDSFQIEQTSLNKLIVKIVPASRYSKSSERRLLEKIREKCGNEMEIRFVYVDKIPLTKSGKMRFVISTLA
jgi:phenylacetate-CoA ligase